MLLRSRRLALAALLTLALAACGDDAAEPTPFNPAGTSEDLAAIEGVYESPVFASFAYAAGRIDQSVMPPALRAGLRLSQSGERAPVATTARAVAEEMRRFTASQQGGMLLSAVLPPELLGTTFELDALSGEYVATDRTGAPANGVRFILYAVDPLTRDPVLPLVETGRLDVLDLSSGSTNSVRFVAVSGSTTYVDYRVSGTVGSQSVNVSVDGFLSDGSERLEFDLGLALSTANGGTLTYDWNLDVPTRDLAFDFDFVITNLEGDLPAATLSLRLDGPNGTVGISGDILNDASELTVTANGGTFAIIAFDGEGNITVTDAQGAPLSPEAEEALRDILDAFETGLELSSFLLAPVDALL